MALWFMAPMTSASDVVIAYAKSLIAIGNLLWGDEPDAARRLATDMRAWLEASGAALNDPDVTSMTENMRMYAANL